MNFEKYKNKGLSGLINLGNTCFINSSMQVLSHTYELNDLLNSSSFKNKIKKNYDSVILNEWNNLRQLLWNENCTVSPNKFLKAIQTIAGIKDLDMFTGYSQNDLPEFLLFVIDCFHNSVCREIKMTISGTSETITDDIAIKCFEMIKQRYSREYSEIWNLFYGNHVSQIISLETGKQMSITPEPFFMIDLPIPQMELPSIIDCFNLYIEGEILTGDNAWYNEETKLKIDVKKQITFWSFPNILIINFKRFNSKNKKNNVLITFPIDNLDLSNYVIGYKKNSYVYELYGICNHMGNSNGGHYTSYVKNANQKWYHFNDNRIEEVKEISQIITPNAYCLFYRKKI
jgi:ubiquitin carboxyl-terminal hydrolase 8